MPSPEGSRFSGTQFIRPARQAGETPVAARQRTERAEINHPTDQDTVERAGRILAEFSGGTTHDGRRRELSTPHKRP